MATKCIVIDHEYFLKELMAFRKVMCSRRYSLKQKEDGHVGLLYVYFNVKRDTKEREELRTAAMDALNVEYERRYVLELFRSCG